jgi:hypothetical protein
MPGVATIEMRSPAAKVATFVASEQLVDVSRMVQPTAVLTPFLRIAKA